MFEIRLVEKNNPEVLYENYLNVSILPLVGDTIAVKENIMFMVEDRVINYNTNVILIIGSII